MSSLNSNPPSVRMTPLRALMAFGVLSSPMRVYAPTISLVSGFWMSSSSWQLNMTSMPRSARTLSSCCQKPLPLSPTEHTCMASAPSTYRILDAQVAGRGVRALLDLRVDAPVVAVVQVVVAFLGPGARQVFGRPAEAEASNVLGGLFHVVHPGELAHVDGRVAAAARRCLLQHQHLGLAFVERGQRSPQAGASVSDDQHVSLVVPCSRHPVGCGRVLLACVGRGAAGKRSRCYRSCRRNACPFEEVAP